MTEDFEIRNAANLCCGIIYGGHHLSEDLASQYFSNMHYFHTHAGELFP